MATSYAQRAGGLLKAAGLSPKKSFGQNFLRDDAVLAHIAGSFDLAPGATVIELGAGLGALTLALLDRGLNVLAVERDRELVPLLGHLEGEAAPGHGALTVLEADAARFDYRAWAKAHGGPAHVFGNLPYQLSGRILGAMGEQADAISGAVVLVQKEVAERMAAPPGSRTYGLLSVLVQRRFQVTLTRPVPPGAFLPPPKVHSAVVRLSRLEAPVWHPHQGDLPEAAFDALFVRCAKAAFGTRRKTLRNALSIGLHLPKDALERAFVGADLDPGARAEVLTLDDFARLTRALVDQGLRA